MNQLDGDDLNEIVLPLSAEELTVGKRAIAERVVVRRETRIRDEAVDELLTDESVVVERVPVGRYVDAMPAVREEGDCTILPVVEEVAVVTRRLLLREEVRLRRVKTSRHHVETVKLREQHAVVTREPLNMAADPAPAALSGLLPPTTVASEPLRSMTMSEETIVAVFDTAAHADAAVADLKTARVPDSAISRHAEGASGTTGTAETATGTSSGSGFWSSLFGGSTTDEPVYDRSMTSGGSVVVVKTPTENVDSVVAILEKHNPVDLDERAANYGYSTQAAGTTAAMPMTTTTATSSYAATGTAATDTAAEGGVLRLAEESLAVGKRLVNQGGTRIRRYVVERPAEADVTLRSESIQVERRPVTDSTAATADFTDKTIEMTATGEEAVVGKTSRVVEEVALRKESSERTETVHDTVRRQEVEVEQVPMSATTTTTKTGPITR